MVDMLMLKGAILFKNESFKAIKEGKGKGFVSVYDIWFEILC
jgi:hypothetical protein